MARRFEAFSSGYPSGLRSGPLNSEMQPLSRSQFGGLKAPRSDFNSDRLAHRNRNLYTTVFAPCAPKSVTCSDYSEFDGLSRAAPIFC